MQEWAGVAGKTVLITGATSGIGLAGAEVLARRGARISMVARDQARAAMAVAQIRAVAGADAEVEVLFADLSSQASIRIVGEEILARHQRIDVLINNAGGVNRTRRITGDGVEMTWAVNHLAPFLLTSLLLDRIKASAPARIVTTSSDAHEGAEIPFDDLDGAVGYGNFGLTRYGQTKLANILFTTELARRLEGSGVTANCYHPGFVATRFNRNNGLLLSIGMTLARPFARDPAKGAETLVWLVDSSEVSSESGGYFFDRKRVQPSEAARDPETARRLWLLSEEETGMRASPEVWNSLS